MNESMKERTIEFFVAPKNVNKKRRCEIEWLGQNASFLSTVIVGPG
jgi:hypothetical protein